jgi:hypothetical protein
MRRPLERSISTDTYVRTVLVQPLQKSGVVRDEDHCKAGAHTRERQGGRVYLHQNDGGGGYSPCASCSFRVRLRKNWSSSSRSFS